MSLCDYCVESNLAWDFELGSAYHYSREDSSIKTIFRFQIPPAPDKQLAIHARRGVAHENRLSFYQDVVRCIQRQVQVSQYLSQVNVNSVLTYSAVEQERTEQGATIIYLETEQVWPILQHLLVGEIPALTVLDVISRLSLILRDIGREPASVVHRGLDLNEVYISAENKILLGGFYYAHCPKLGPFTDFLPGGPAHIPAAVRQGNPGSHKTDIQSLSAIAWNLFSGLPHDCEINTKRRTTPEFSFPELDEALLLGLAGEDEVCNAFRRRLSDCRKLLNKPDSPQIAVPIRQQRMKDFRVNLVQTEDQHSVG